MSDPELLLLILVTIQLFLFGVSFGGWLEHKSQKKKRKSKA